MPLNRRTELICLGYILITAIAVRIWILVVNTDDTYIEIVASVVTILLFIAIYIRIRRRQNNDENERDDLQRRNPQDVDIARYLLSTFENRIPRSSALSPELIMALPRIVYSQELSDGQRSADHETNPATPLEEGQNTTPIGSSAFPATIEAGWMKSDEEMCEKKCPICLEVFVNGSVLIRLPCCHDYHERCIVTWLNYRSTCPLCARLVVVERRPIPAENQPSINATPPVSAPPQQTNPPLEEAEASFMSPATAIQSMTWSHSTPQRQSEV